MKVNLSGLLRQAANRIDPANDRAGYAYMLTVVADHIIDVREGRHTLEEFADFYKLTPASTASPHTPSVEDAGEQGGV